MLSIEQLTKTFSMRILGDKQIPGCRDVSFPVEEGQFFALAGPSGIGKSTVLKCIYRTYLPDSGRIWFSSQHHGRVDLASAPERLVLDIRSREMGFVSQFLDVIPRVSALDLVIEPLLAQYTPRQARNRAIRILKQLAIPEELFDAFPATFSGGEQQRINIARAVARSPRLLLLDEPTASLDADSIERVLDLLDELRRAGTTMVGIFHDAAVMERTASRVLTLQEGLAHAS